jgi:hypothetical protein
MRVAPVEEVLGRLERQERLLLAGGDTPSPAPSDNLYRSCVKGTFCILCRKLSRKMYVWHS